MKQYILNIKILLCIGLVMFLTGFIVATSSPSNIYIAIPLMLFSQIFYLIALIYAVKLILLKHKQKTIKHTTHDNNTPYPNK